MATHLTLLCHAATRAMRDGAFAAAEESLDAGGLAKLAAFRLDGPPPQRLLTGAALAARQTAAHFGAPVVEAALADIDAGDWTGRSLAELHASDPTALAAWLADPAGGTPGGETMAAVMRRVGGWLGDIAGSGARIVAVSHPAVLRAAIAVVLGAPPAATAAIDIAPLTAVTLSFHRVWRLREIRAA